MNPALPEFPALQTPARILLGPGPSMADPAVLRAMATPLLGHLDPQLLEMMDAIQVLLRHIFETDNPLTLAVSGTGSAAMEAAVANLVEPGDRVLVCVKGYFAARIAEMAQRYGGEVQTIQKPWGEAFTAAEVAQALERFPARIVAIVHAETSTGVLQPLEEIAAEVHHRGALLLVDAVTSLGGVSVGVDRVGIDACYSAAQKCLSCPPGLSPLTFGPRAEEKLRARKTPVCNWYLDLTLLAKYWGAERAYHHTISAPLVYALYEGLRLAAAEGLENRWARHRANAETFWHGLAELDLQPHVPPALRLPSLTTIRIPAGVDDLAIRRRLLNEYNIEIAGGLGELKGRVWRVGLMGYSSRRENITLLLAALADLLA